MSMDEGRLKRGRAYSGPNRLLKFSINKGVATATLRGNVNRYFGVYEEPRYKVTVKLRQFSSSDWNRISEMISKNAACLSQLLMNEMPTANRGMPFRSRARPCCRVRRMISSASARVRTGPRPASTLQAYTTRSHRCLIAIRCSCSNCVAWNFLCFARSLQVHPSDGLSLTNRLTKTDPLNFPPNATRTRRVTPAAGIDLKSYWRGEHPLPSVDTLSGVPPTPAVLAKKGGDHPAFWHQDQSFIGVMEEVCTRVVQKNRPSL